jgi:F-type H+-transporting ATPase subunit gamma
MATQQELRRRLKSVTSTRQITRTMEMVATSKLKRAQDRITAARPYAQALADVIADLYAPELEERFPLLRRPEGNPARAALILITSNRGLCGGFNANLIRMARNRVTELESAGTSVDLHLIGKKGIGFFRYIGQETASERQDIGDSPTAEHASEVANDLMRQFEDREVDAVEVIYASFRSAMSTPPTAMRILPVEPQVADKGKEPNYILKPSGDAIIAAVLPLYVRNSLYRALVETAASEHGARRAAMKSATDNAGDMIKHLRRDLNRIRQAKITQEIAEIVGGADALGG